MDKISIYIHWPFCIKKCPYCDFNSHEFNFIDHNKFEEAYIKQIHLYLPYIKSLHPNINSIFIGGGTPTTAEVFVIESIINTIGQYYNLSDVEITIEANPTSSEASKFKDLKNAGVNRISIGVQSFHDNHLKFLQRTHNNTQALNAIDFAANTFDNYSFDLIYALPSQTLEELHKDLTKIIGLNPTHVSLYQLTIEKGTKFYKDYHQNHLFELPKEDLSFAMYNLCEEILSHKYKRYEISNYASFNENVLNISRHNMHYWEYKPFFGIGPGAHSRLFINNEAFEVIMHHDPKKWLTHALESEFNHIEHMLNKNTYDQKTAIQSISNILPKDAIKEEIMMGMRATCGIDYNKLLIDESKIESLIKEEYCNKISSNIVVPTSKGMNLHSSIVDFLTK
jgi:putative oxygen-independent coproporphyrinogen III oxidase